MKILISLQSLLQQLDLLVALDATSFRICAALSIALILVEANHLLNTGLVLFLYAKLELQLRQHELNLRAQVGRVILNQVLKSETHD